MSAGNKKDLVVVVSIRDCRIGMITMSNSLIERNRLHL